MRDSCSLFAAFVAFMGHWGGKVVTFTAFVVFMRHWSWTFVAFTAFLAFRLEGCGVCSVCSVYGRWGWTFVAFTGVCNAHGVLPLGVCDVYSVYSVYSGAPRAHEVRSSRALLLRKFGNLSIRKILVVTSPYARRPSVHALHVNRCQMSHLNTS